MRLVSILFLSLPLLAADLSTDGWKAVGPGSAVATVDGVLTLHYDANAERSLAVLPVAGGLVDMKALRFEVRTDSPFAVAFVLMEKPGGNRPAAIWSHGGDWQPVVLKPEDFGLTDLNHVAGVALTDLSQRVGSMAHNPRIYSQAHQGPHTISVRNFEILRDAAPANEPQSSWFSPGGASFERKDGATVVRYQGVADQWIAFSHLIPAHDYSGSTHLAMDIETERDTQFVISIHSGTERNNIDFFVPAGTSLDHREVLLSAFSGKLDLTAIQSVTLLDVGGDAAANRITIRDLRFVTR